MLDIVLVIGSSRSGKSLLCALFDGHPAVQVWPLELGLSKHFGEWLDGPALATTPYDMLAQRAEALLANADRQFASFYEEFDLAAVDVSRLRRAFGARLAGSRSADVASVLLHFGESVAAAMGSSPKVVLLDVKVKTAHLGTLLASSTPLRFVFMRRDPGDVYLALRAKHFSNYGTGNWLTGDGRPLLRSLVDHIDQYSGGPHVSVLATDPKVCVLRYEELVREPEKVLSRVATWLGVEARWELMTLPTRFRRPATLDRHARGDWRVQGPGLSAPRGRLSLIEQAVLRCCFALDPVTPATAPAVGLLRRALLALACLVPLAGELMRFMRGHWVDVVRAGVLNRVYAMRVLSSERVG